MFQALRTFLAKGISVFQIQDAPLDHDLTPERRANIEGYEDGLNKVPSKAILIRSPILRQEYQDGYEEGMADADEEELAA